MNMSGPRNDLHFPMISFNFSSTYLMFLISRVDFCTRLLHPLPVRLRPHFFPPTRLPPISPLRVLNTAPSLEPAVLLPLPRGCILPTLMTWTLTLRSTFLRMMSHTQSHIIHRNTSLTFLRPSRRFLRLHPSLRYLLQTPSLTSPMVIRRYHFHLRINLLPWPTSRLLRCNISLTRHCNTRLPLRCNSWLLSQFRIILLLRRLWSPPLPMGLRITIMSPSQPMLPPSESLHPQMVFPTIIPFLCPRPTRSPRPPMVSPTTITFLCPRPTQSLRPPTGLLRLMAPDQIDWPKSAMPCLASPFLFTNPQLPVPLLNAR